MAKYLVPLTQLREVDMSHDVVMVVDQFIESHVVRNVCGLSTNEVIKEGFSIPSREEFVALAYQIIEVYSRNERRRRRKKGEHEEREGGDCDTHQERERSDSGSAGDSRRGGRGRSGIREAHRGGGRDSVQEGGDGSDRTHGREFRN